MLSSLKPCFLPPLSFLRVGLRVGVNPPSVRGMSASLEDLFAQCGVNTSISYTLLTDGWTLTTWASCASSLEAFDVLLPNLCEQENMPLLQQAALRAAFKQAAFGNSSSASPSSGPKLPDSGTSESSWTDTFAPKLDPQTIKDLKSKFIRHYPSELLNSETMPSTRLLSLVHHQLVKKQWVWVPWRFRMSVSRAEEVTSQRASKVPRIEHVALSSLLLDDPPALEISNAGMGINAIRNMLEVHNVAIGLCQGAHLQNLKAYSHKFMSLLTQKVDPDSGLRTASVVESQAADRQIWTTSAELMTDRDWSMDDALHELTHIRNDLSGYLQLRPRVLKPFSPSGPRSSDSHGPAPWKGKQKGKGKGKNKDKSKTRTQWVTDIHRDGKWQQLCMRYQSGKRSSSDCKFVHACAFPKQDGTACGAAHSAFDHQKTPH